MELLDVLESHFNSTAARSWAGVKFRIDPKTIKLPGAGLYRKETYYDTPDFSNLQAGVTIRNVSVPGKEDIWTFKSATLRKVLEFTESTIPVDVKLSGLESIAVIRVMRFVISDTSYLDVCCFDVDDFYLVATDLTSNAESNVNGKLLEYLLFHSNVIYNRDTRLPKALASPCNGCTMQLNPDMHADTPVFKEASELETGLSYVEKYAFKVNREIEMECMREQRAHPISPSVDCDSCNKI